MRGQRRRARLADRAGLAHPAARGFDDVDWLAIHVGADLAYRRDRAHRRCLRQHAVDGGFDFQRHGVAAVGTRSRRQRLHFQRIEAAGIAPADITVERLLAFAHLIGHGFALAGDGGTLRRERQFVERALLLVQRAVDAIDLLVGDDIGRTFFERRQPLVIGALEGVERPQEFVERLRDFAVVRRGIDSLGFQFHFLSPVDLQKLAVIPGRARSARGRLRLWLRRSSEFQLVRRSLLA